MGNRPNRNLALSFFNIHTAMMAQFPKNKKPTVGFQARFFLEGFAGCKFMASNVLQIKKSRKTERTQNKMSFFLPGPGVFSAKTPPKPPFFPVSTFFKTQARLMGRILTLPPVGVPR